MDLFVTINLGLPSDATVFQNNEKVVSRRRACGCRPAARGSLSGRDQGGWLPPTRDRRDVTGQVEDGFGEYGGQAAPRRVL